MLQSSAKLVEDWRDDMCNLYKYVCIYTHSVYVCSALLASIPSAAIGTRIRPVALASSSLNEILR